MKCFGLRYYITTLNMFAKLYHPSSSFYYVLFAYPFKICLYVYVCTQYVDICRQPNRDKHKLVPSSFHPFACCCVWLLWCSRGGRGKLAGGGVNLMLGLGFLTRGKMMPTQKRLQLSADTRGVGVCADICMNHTNS